MSLERVTASFDIELSGSTKRYAVTAKQGDKATRYVAVTLVDHESEYSIPAGSVVTAFIKKPDGTNVYEACTFSGATVTVELSCTLRNAGVRLRVAPDFLTSYPDGVLFLKSGDTRLMYGYAESRIAYFQPGPVTLILYNEGKDETLLSRTLESRTILTLAISAPDGGQAAGSSIRVAVDTTKTWNNEGFVIGGNGNPDDPDKGADTTDAYTVSEAGGHAGENDVWVYGYIVGGDLSTAGSTVKTSNITKNTHLAIAARSSVTAKASCVAVELPKGSVRDGLNLVDHPDLIGSRVYLKGNLVTSYFGTTGLKSVSDYVLK